MYVETVVNFLSTQGIDFGLKILGVILIGTFAVMGVTALTIDLCWRWQANRIAH